MSSSLEPRVLLAVGKRPRSGTLVAEVADLLGAAGVEVQVRLPHEDPDALRTDRAPDLLVHRGLRPEALAAVVDLERQGVPCCNPARACQAVADRSVVVRALAAAGVPVPPSTTGTTWSQVREELARGPRVVKSVAGTAGRSTGVVRLGGPVDEPPFDGPWQVQEPVEHDGVDRKLYVAGSCVRGLLKPALLTRGTAGDPAPARPFVPDDDLADLARAAGDALGLHLHGVDVLLGPAGPVVVDVNPLPGFRGVDGAARLVVDHLLGHLTTR